MSSRSDEGLTTTSSDERDQTVDLRPSRSRLPFVLSGFRIIGVLGQGGMGTVYEAEQIEPLRRVAIKVLDSRSSSSFVRFKTEAQIMARLDHPGIAKVLASGESGEHPYLVMEFVDGQLLDAYSKDLSARAKLELFVQVCDAVHHAHCKGVIHRDLKPGNVLVREGGRVVVLDFGIARLAEPDGTTPGATIAGEILGTPIYMSPEQARLRADEVDARSDVYTLGVILYELLSGELPYDVRELSVARVADAICDQPPTPLGVRMPALRGDLQAVTAKALAKRQGERYHSAAALADDVRRFLDGRSVSVRNPNAIERVTRFVRRRPWIAVTIGAAAVALAVFVVVVTTLWWSARAARRDAEHAHDRAATARDELEARTNQLVLRQARAALSRDPTEAIAWLATLTPRGVDPATAWAIADEALGRGVASHVLRAHTDQVHRVEHIPGSEGFATAGYDSRVIVWGGTPLAQRATIAIERGRIHVARPSPDGTRLAIGGDAGQVLTARPDGAVVARLGGHAGSVQDVAWSKTGAHLATGDDHGNLIVWDGGDPPGRTLATSRSGIAALAFSEDGAALAAGDQDGALWVFDVASGGRRTAKLGGELIGAWSERGDRWITVDNDGEIVTWTTGASGELVRAGAVATKQKLKRVAFAPGAAWMALGGVGGAVLRVEGERVEQLGQLDAQVRAVAVSRDGRWIANGTDDGTLELRDLMTGLARPLRGHRGRIRHVSFIPDRTGAGDVALLSSDSDGVVRRWDLPAASSTVLSTAGEALTALALSSDHGVLAAVDAAGTVSRWTLRDGMRAVLGTTGARTPFVAATRGLAITSTVEGAVAWWGEPTQVTAAVPGGVKALVASRDHVAISTAAGPIAMFAYDGKPLPALSGHAGGSDALAFDPSGTLLASGGQDRRIRLWRAGAGGFTPAGVLDGGLRGDTRFVAFSPHGELLAVAGNDGQVVTWRVTGGVVAPAATRVAQHTGAVTALAFSPDGTLLVSGGRDATLAIRELPAGTSRTATLSGAAIALAFDAANGVHAVTYGGAVVRWSNGVATTEIDHGVRAAVGLSDGRWGLAFDDGALMLTARSERSLAELHAIADAATTYRLAP